MPNQILVTVSDTALFDAVWILYEQSFPLEERRTKAQQLAVMNHSEYRLEALSLQQSVVGMLGYWRFPEMIFVEHFAISPNFRNGGLGKIFLNKFIEKEKMPLWLEVELPTDELQHRRIGFYQRIGFQLNKHNYSQPPYHQGFLPIPMLVMSYPKAISTDDLSDFVMKYHPKIYYQNIH